MLRNERTVACLLMTLLTGSIAIAQDKAQTEPPAIPVEQFAKLHLMVKPQAGELRFHEIPWLLNVWDARKKAAEEGKPLLIWSGAGGAPLGVC